MKKIITIIVLLITISGTAQSPYFLPLELDSLKTGEYIPNRYLEASGRKEPLRYISLSAGIQQTENGNEFYGVYVDFDSSIVKKDTLIYIVTNYGSYELSESKYSKDLNAPFTAIFVPRINPDKFYKFISKGIVKTVTFSGANFDVTLNNTYFSDVFKEIKIITNYIK